MNAVSLVKLMLLYWKKKIKAVSWIKSEEIKIMLVSISNNDVSTKDPAGASVKGSFTSCIH